MAFTVGDFQDLLRLLEQQPEWREQLRRHVLTDELMTMPAGLQRNTDTQREIERNLASITERLDRMAARQDHHDALIERLTERVDALTARVDGLATQMKALTARVDGLAVQMEALTARVDGLAVQMEALTARVDGLAVQMEALTARVDGLAVQMEALTARVDGLAILMEALTARVDGLAILMEAVIGRLDRLDARMDGFDGRMDRMDRRMDRVEVRLSDLDGAQLEDRFARDMAGYLGHLGRRFRVLNRSALADLLDDGVEAGTLTPEDRQAALLADAVAHGRRALDDAAAYFVAEVSAHVDKNDVIRVAQRSRIIAKLGLPVIPIVAGRVINHRARSEAVAGGIEWVRLPGTSTRAVIDVA